MRSEGRLERSDCNTPPTHFTDNPSRTCFARAPNPNPFRDSLRSSQHPLKSVYNFYTWSEQLTDFIEEVVGGEATLACNSIGSCAGLQAAIDRPELVKGVVILDPSLRLLNAKRQNPFFVPIVSAFQKLLRETFVGKVGPSEERRQRAAKCDERSESQKLSGKEVLYSSARCLMLLYTIT